MKKNIFKKGLSLVFSAILVVSSFSTAYAQDDVVVLETNAAISNEKSDTQHESSFDGRNAEDLIATVGGDVKITPFASAQNDGYYEAFSGYLTAQNQSRWLDIILYPGEVLHCQMDVPNSSQLDYDLYLYETSSDFMTLLSDVDSSEYGTNINGTSGTLSEAVGVVNRSSQIKYYSVEAYSYLGSSVNMPFTWHVGINSSYDQFETNENLWNSQNITLETSGNTTVNNHSMDTLIDNDCYFFTVPYGLNYNKVNISLDSASINSGYGVEVYSQQSGLRMKKESNSLSLTVGQSYLIRVSSEFSNYLTGSNYILKLVPEAASPVVNQVKILTITGFDQATYNGVTRYRINQNTTAIITGQALANGAPVANAYVTVTIENTYFNSKKEATVKTDINGNFSANVTTGSAAGSNQAYLSGAINFIHYYDMGKFYATADNVRSSETPIYMFAYSVRA